MILVVGATGLLGGEICRRLRERNLPVRALVRAGSPKAVELSSLGVEVSTGDLRNDADVEKACAGVATVISTATAMGSKDKSLRLRDVDYTGQLRLLDAARRGGAQRYVFISAAPALSSDAPLIRYKRLVEAAIRASSMRWTNLQPAAFMEVWLGEPLGWDTTAGKAMMFGPGDNPMNFVSIHDVAELAIRCLDDPRFHDVDVPVGGPEAITPLQVRAIFERLSGRRWTTRHVPLLLLRSLRPFVARFNEAAASGMAMGADTHASHIRDLSLQGQLGVELTTVEQYAERVLRR